MKRLFLIVPLWVGIVTSTYAQYPKITEDVKQTSDSLLNKAKESSDHAWEKAWPIVQQEAQNGRPYVPWASRPDDLPQADLLAFPGAEGGGAYTPGGRGGKVLVVTSLEDSGPGTLRWACEQGGARTIVFNVAGIIRLKSPLIIRAPYITIAGQSAPGDGVCVAGETVWIDTHDVIIRYMRFRRGETWVGRRDDAIGGNPIGNIIIDHVSASWGLDENMSIYRHMYDDGTDSPDKKYGTVNITIQNSIFSEALDTWNHSFGSTLGGENCSFIRNLWANNAGRNPSVGWNGVFNFANNIIFNWVHRNVDGGDYQAKFNIINNYYKPGPATPMDSRLAFRILKPEAGRSKLAEKTYGRAYVEGNIVEGNEKVTTDNWDGGVQIESLPNAAEYTEYIRARQPFAKPEFSVLDAGEAYEYVLNNVGAQLPKQDAVDARIVRTVRTGKPEYPENVQLPTEEFEHRRLPKDSYKSGIITTVDQVGGYPDYKGVPYNDSDGDGIPDEWEKNSGLNANDPADASKYADNGYTNIENYLNSLVKEETVAPVIAKK
ncbi:polysaccharide lyase [Olivibacter sp. SDN3]|uniref:polysaccharide lyase n=1 Tax=Olivibacter sp. SDN3 TaxID=2764720 RepID=UPI0016513D9E|nr:polysaccharide lyase [Olivibacter sp. SDN3]QNL52253.1 polysaccharide lyase [Olivibacter sp. SDN3]